MPEHSLALLLVKSQDWRTRTQHFRLRADLQRRVVGSNLFEEWKQLLELTYFQTIILVMPCLESLLAQPWLGESRH